MGDGEGGGFPEDFGIFSSLKVLERPRDRATFQRYQLRPMAIPRYLLMVRLGVPAHLLLQPGDPLEAVAVLVIAVRLLLLNQVAEVVRVPELLGRLSPDPLGRWREERAVCLEC